MFEILLNHYPVLLKGLTTTLVVSLSAIALGLVLGVLLAFGLTSRYRLVRWPCGLYRSFWRGTPILLQLLLVNGDVVLVLELLDHRLLLPQVVLHSTVHQHPPRVKAKNHRGGAAPLVQEVGERAPPDARRQVRPRRHAARSQRFEGTGSRHGG